MNTLQLENLSYKYEKNSSEVLKNVNLTFENGKTYAIVGKSGAGKTTLLSLLSGLATPTGGKILYDGKDISKIDRYEYRSKYVGVIFQKFNLLPQLSATENVVLSMNIVGMKEKNKTEIAHELLGKVEIEPEEYDRRVLKL